MISGACEKHCMTRASCLGVGLPPRTRPMISVKCGLPMYFIGDAVNGLVAKPFLLRSELRLYFCPGDGSLVTRPYAASRQCRLRAHTRSHGDVFQRDMRMGGGSRR